MRFNPPKVSNPLILPRYHISETDALEPSRDNIYVAPRFPSYGSFRNSGDCVDVHVIQGFAQVVDAGWNQVSEDSAERCRPERFASGIHAAGRCLPTVLTEPRERVIFSQTDSDYGFTGR